MSGAQIEIGLTKQKSKKAGQLLLSKTFPRFLLKQEPCEWYLVNSSITEQVLCKGKAKFVKAMEKHKSQRLKRLTQPFFFILNASEYSYSFKQLPSFGDQLITFLLLLLLKTHQKGAAASNSSSGKMWTGKKQKALVLTVKTKPAKVKLQKSIIIQINYKSNVAFYIRINDSNSCPLT